MIFSEDFIAKVKASADIVDIVAETVQLRRSGKQLTGLSPFTKEKTPSYQSQTPNYSFIIYFSQIEVVVIIY